MNPIYTNSPKCQSCVRYTLRNYSDWCDFGIYLQACDSTCDNPDKCNYYIQKHNNNDTRRSSKRGEQLE